MSSFTYYEPDNFDFDDEDLYPEPTDEDLDPNEVFDDIDPEYIEIELANGHTAMIPMDIILFLGNVSMDSVCFPTSSLVH